MNNLEYVYNLGLQRDFQENKLSSEKYKLKLEANKAIQANLSILDKQVSLLKAVSNSSTVTMESYAYILESLALNLLKRNVQARNYDLNKLTGYGNKLNTIRKNIYTEQNTVNGFIGTLLVYQPTDEQSLSIGNLIDRTLINYWNYLEIDYTKPPRIRFKEVLSKINLDLDTKEYIKLTQTIKTLLLNDTSVKKKYNSYLLTPKDLENLFLRVIVLEVDSMTESFYEWLYSQGYISIDISEALYNGLNYKPIGGVILVLLAFLVEAFILAAHYIRDLAREYRVLEVSQFILKEETTVYSQNIAIYLALALDATNWLAIVFEEFELLKEAITVDLSKFIKDPILAKGYFRLDV